MNKIITTLFILFFFFCSEANAQQDHCKPVHTGIFQFHSDEYGTTILKRDKDFQTEINEKLGYEVILKINWIDECTYELRFHKLIKGDPAIISNNVVTTRISNVTPKGYDTRTTMEGADFVLEMHVEIVTK